MEVNFGDSINSDKALYYTALFHDGRVLHTLGGRFKKKCIIDVSLYPFDSHTCLAFVYSRKYSSNIMYLHLPYPHVIWERVNDNQEWEVTKTDMYITEEPSVFQYGVCLSALYFKIWVKRRPSYTIVNHIIPAAVLTMLMALTCFIPPDCGERLSFVITVYLATVFLSAGLIDDIPKVSIKNPYLSYLIAANNVLYAIMVGWSIVVVRISRFNDQKEMPVWIHKIVMKRSCKNKVEAKEDGDTDVYEAGDVTDEDECLTWLKAALELDYIFRVVFSIVMLILLFSFAFVFFASLSNAE